MEIKQYDVVVVGGGIHGAGVLQAAAAAGHSALLIERDGLASGTSSRSSKLIHGGLRYLESGQFALVRESLRERAIHLRIAAELVELKPFFIPVYRDTRRRPWQLKVGLWMYALLGGFDASTRFGTVARSEWSSLDGLKTQGLEAVIRYYDAQTDDALLTRAVVQSALSLGAELAMPASFTGATLTEHGVKVFYNRGGSTVETSARVLDEFFQRHPRTDRILVAAATDTSALGALQATIHGQREKNVAIVGQFSSFADSSNIGKRRDTARSKNSENEDIDNNIEVYVLTDSAFTVWQHGYATSSVYESGKVSEGSVQADVPAGAGIYYLVFSNKAAPKAAKNVHAAVLLRYKSWLPEWFRRMKGRVLDWVGAA